MSEKAIQHVEKLAGIYLERASVPVAEQREKIKQHYAERIKQIEEVCAERVAAVEGETALLKAVGEKLPLVAKGMAEKLGGFDIGKLEKRVRRYYQLTAEQIVELYVEYEQLKQSGELGYNERWNKIDTKAAALIEKAGLKVEFEIVEVPKFESDDAGDEDDETDIEDEDVDDEDLEDEEDDEDDEDDE